MTKGTAKRRANRAKVRGEGKVEEVWGTNRKGQGRRAMMRAVSMGRQEGREEGRQEGMEEWAGKRAGHEGRA